MENSNKKKSITNQSSLDKDYRRFNNEMNSEIKVQKKMKKLIFKSTQNIRDEILLGEINFAKKFNENENIIGT